MNNRSSLVKQLLPFTTVSVLVLMLTACQINSSNNAEPVQSGSYASYQSYQATDLRCELLTGEWLKEISDATPEFSWAIASEKNDAMQVAYQIQAWQLKPSGEELVWDSGKVMSSQSNAVSYAGNSLSGNRDYQWRVKVWLQNNNGKVLEGAWSQPQRFTTASEFNADTSTHALIASPVKAKSIKKLASGRYLVDFGKSAFGYLELGLTSNKAGLINVHFAERGTDAGIIANLPKKSSVRYYKVPLEVITKTDTYLVNPPRDTRNTKSGKAIEIPGRFGRIAPFRYVEIEANGLELSDIKPMQMVVHYPFDAYTSSFESSDETLDAVWQLSKYSMKATSFAGIYVDGDRERIPYEADAYINQLSHYLVDSEYAMARLSHEYLLEHPTWPTEWKQHSIMMAWMDWLYTGDRESLEKSYQVLKTEKAFLQLANRQGLLESFPPTKERRKRGQSRDIVDWPANERDGFEFKKVNTVVNAFHYLNLRQMTDIALVLGKHKDAELFKQKADNLYQAFNQYLFDSTSGLYIDGIGSKHSSAHANILPLAVGLVPAERSGKIIDFLKTKKMAVSVYFAQYLLEALYESDQAEYALSLLTSKELRSWYNMLRVGSTITLEAWDDKFKPNQDWNHAWGAVPGNIAGRYILGVKPTTPGFEQFEIAPKLGGLTFAKGKVPTIKGPVFVDAKQTSDKQFNLNVEIPNNSQATVIVPIAESKSISSVTVNGKTSTFSSSSGVVGNGLFAPGSYQIEVKYQ